MFAGKFRRLNQCGQFKKCTKVRAHKVWLFEYFFIVRTEERTIMVPLKREILLIVRHNDTN